LAHLIDRQEQTGNVQKGALSKAAGPFSRGAYGLVREHDKGPRTPLTPFFNIPTGKALPSAGNPTRNKLIEDRECVTTKLLQNQANEVFGDPSALWHNC